MTAGHGHSHGHAHAHPAGAAGDDAATPALETPPGLRNAMVAVVVAVTVATLAGLMLLWPDGDVAAQTRPTNAYAGVTFTSGEVLSTSESVCEGASEDRLPDGSIPDQTVCVAASVQLEGGRRVEVQIPPEVKRAGLGDGDRVRLARYPADADLPETYAWVDYDRRLPLGILAAVFALVVIGVARLKGLAALAGLAIAYPVIFAFMLPALRAGENAVLIALVGAAAIMIPVLYLAHGLSAKTTVALFGTLAGLLVTAGLAVGVTVAADLTGLVNEEAYRTSQLTTGAGLSGLIICGMIIAGLGVLNDVTIAQAASVWELRAIAPHLSVRALFGSGMRIGRDHLASTVYTIAFAYAGAGLPILLLIDLYEQPLMEVLNGGEVGGEIARTLVGAIGLVATIPLTTAIAAAVAASARPVRDRPGPDFPDDVDDGDPWGPPPPAGHERPTSRRELRSASKGASHRR
jgi:uncharacterized membrane protein